MYIVPETMRPGVYTYTHISPAYAKKSSRTGAVLIAPASTGDTDVVHKTATLAEVITLFGTDADGAVLASMARILLDAGVFPLYCIGMGTDIDAALAAAQQLCDIGAVILGSAQKDDLTALSAHVQSCSKSAKERIGVAPVSLDSACTLAQALNDPHMVLCCDAGSATHLTAAALGAKILTSDPSANFNGISVPVGETFDGTLTAQQVENLLKSGVTPFEKVGSDVVCIRAVTTCTQQDGLADNTFSSLSTVLAADEVVSSIRAALKKRLHGLRNNPATRESIATQITIELEAKKSLGLIDSYQLPTVSVHPQDSGICVAQLAFKVAPEVSQIVIMAEIQM